MTQLEEIEAAAARRGALLTAVFDPETRYVWTLTWHQEHPVDADQTVLVRCASRKEYAAELLHNDLENLGILKGE